MCVCIYICTCSLKVEDNPSWPNSSVEDSRKDEAAGLPKPTVKGAPMSLTYCLLYCGIGQLIETYSDHDASIVHCKKITITIVCNLPSNQFVFAVMHGMPNTGSKVFPSSVCAGCHSKNM